MKSIYKIALAFLITTIAACSHYSRPFEMNTDIKAINYRAADALIQSATAAVSSETPIVIATIADTNQLESSSPLGRTISEQVMTRLVQSGYNNVSEIRLRRSLYLRERSANVSGEFLLSRDARAIAEARQAGAAITGTYAAGKDQVLVSLRMIEVATGKILASQDYTIPMDSNVEKLLGDSTGASADNAIFSNTQIYTGF
ncbi:MAG: hypothetical protein CMH30_06395 [Micavibrio sp.]|nr:hypothetical protein [Micavibrio sp.]|tara:strand:- start:2676 stop:3278 length:603 start_codon:yes stop_codon:yes gene_type:complete